MLNKYIYRACAVVTACAMTLCGCRSNRTSVTDVTTSIDTYEKDLELARTTPFARYPEQITYTLGKLIGSNNSNMPEGDTYTDNAYTRLLLSMLNIQNEDTFEAMSEDYTSNINMAIQLGKMPDIMVVDNAKDLELLVEYDMIADLRDAYKNCMSDTIKDMYNSYGDGIFESVTFDGKLMAIPETNIEDGPNLIWLRKDWMDKLGLSEPKTLQDVEYIVSEFIAKDPGNNGIGQTVGLVCDPKLCGECGYSNEYLLDIVFASFGAYPKQWIYNSLGEVVYGSVQSEAKAALNHIREMYSSRILDNNFLLRTTSNIIELVVGGRCGSFFGPWWAPNNPLMDAITNDNEAKWMPYLIATNSDGTTSYYSKQPTYKYVVVRKDFQYPEIVCKMVSVLFDYIRYHESTNEEFKKYYQINVDPTARPIAINVDYNNALSLCYDEITKAINKDKDPNDLLILERSYYEACKAYIEATDGPTPQEWAAYMSRIEACQLIASPNVRVIRSLFFGTTKTMESVWWRLLEDENKTYLKIVTGELEIDEFDAFVERWYADGGDTIRSEVNQIMNN